jgi:hypothetical protein
MLSDRKRTELLEMLAAWDRLIEDDDTTDLENEPEIVGRMQAVDTRIRQLCPPTADPLPWAYTPLDTVRPDLEAEGGIR